ncbi:hypothetical protein IU438_11720 [Nocardia cyriacigeorgica]|uniref:hypothetical protein n=1 Tax=Nocardia cyriacigeorgica TaxID=135487 RepID=UPI001895717B|nr:hypothetical protein [Nocardia cyriacigeorgica]MBF6096659.1 hypothetical protein [Nocardia cyriacigeorgica]MBF6162474.1 hypothetical protein [Nocardia cyriacigeorgica]MBF6201542.1 hypothetical protein [Nocardia cyriacigeorgica]MBF6317041.1 hypothetical protein [Nocardia cyriacigeorgica]MBF6396461.1 hypothetical protein [Nocardia cyriacigeorgica]
MADPLSETVKIDGADAAVLARDVRSRAGDIRNIKSGQASAGITAGFPGFEIGSACTTACDSATKTLQQLATTLESISDNTVTVAAKFLHIDEARAREFDRLGGTP